MGRVDEDAYIPGPGSLFAPVYGAAPPPAQPRAQVVEPDLDDEDLDVDEEASSTTTSTTRT